MSEAMSSEKAIKRNQENIANLIEANRNAHEAASIGIVTVETLEQQNEDLADIEITLCKNEELVDRSLRKLRGMTWSGSLYNACSDVVLGIQSIGSQSGKTNAPSSIAASTSMKSTNPTLQSQASSSPGYTTSPPSTYAFGSSNETSIDTNDKKDSQQQQEDALLNDLSRVAATLHKLGITMGEQLETGDAHLESIEAKTDMVHQKTINATVKVNKLQRSHTARDHGKYIGTYQFYLKHFHKLLGCNAQNELVLTSIAGVNTLFRVHTKYDTLVAIQSVQTGKYLGTTIWGSIAILGNYFGSQEECYFDLPRTSEIPKTSTKNNNSSNKKVLPTQSEVRETGILFLSRNWGSGGWLKLTGYQKATEELQSNNSDSDNDTNNYTTKTRASWSSPVHRALVSHEDVILAETTINPLDKEDFLLFLPIKSMKD